MVEYSDAINTAIHYVSDATKGANSLAALFNSASKTNSEFINFLRIFKRSKNDESMNLSISELIQSGDKKILEVKNLNGVLAPIMDFKGGEETDYKAVSKAIKSDVVNIKIRTPENEFLQTNSKEWMLYGCSLQSTVQDRIQILSLIDDEEINSLPVLVSDRFYKRKLDDPSLPYGINASLTGVVLSISDNSVKGLIGAKKTKQLELSGTERVIIPDETLIEDLSIDFSFSPDVFYNNEKCFFLGYLWVVYMNVRTNDIVPIYEYGNLGDKNSFIILTEKLIHQIEFFKKRIWSDLDRPVMDRQYHLLVSYNDELTSMIQAYFQEQDYFSSREDLIYQCREEIIETMFD